MQVWLTQGHLQEMLNLPQHGKPYQATLEGLADCLLFLDSVGGGGGGGGGGVAMLFVGL